ncbi:glycosyltransferase [Flaviaesturariibacter amylovorans]|uniref:Glycosyl transferase family 28 C-terminal domain-containing protein n=1 Tax=Flaviaesturariibacter amylovorans TaxID=1084520 RepID=A0ABP8GRW8_9BACT
MNIFITIGSQEPFDRLLRIADNLAPEFPGVSFVAQTTKGGFAAKHIHILDFIPPAQFRKYIEEADLIVSHAGIGTMLKVLELEKPLIVFPRKAAFRETRDDHQVATMHAFVRQGYVAGAETAEEFRSAIGRFLSGNLRAAPAIAAHASAQLLHSIEEFL